MANRSHKERRPSTKPVIFRIIRRSPFLAIPVEAEFRENIECVTMIAEGLTRKYGSLVVQSSYDQNGQETVWNDQRSVT